MSRRPNPRPRALVDVPAPILERFWADYRAAAARERGLPREERLYYNIGPSYLAAGWRLAYEWLLREMENPK